MNLGYIYNYQDYEELIRSNFQKEDLLHQDDIPLDYHGYYIGIGVQLCKKEDGNYYFVADLSKVPYHRVRDLAVPRHIHDLAFLLAICNKYIPIYDTNGNLLVTMEEFKELRRKMSGLSEYDAGEFQFSDNLNLPDIEVLMKDMEKDRKQVALVAPVIEQRTKQVVEQRMGLTGGIADLKTSYELINTGSTGRGTNVPNDFDFDFAVRMELGEFRRTFSSKSFANVSRLQSLLQEEFVLVPSNLINVTTARLKLHDVNVHFTKENGEETEEKYDIDFSFFSNIKSFLSTVGALEQRLEQIRVQNPEKYYMVLANIVYAKKVLKAGSVYKPSRSDKSQGGLGGVGIENWILQYGGSFIDAAQSFVDAAKKCIEMYNVDLNDINNYNNDSKDGPAYKAFIEFQKIYPVFDFGKSLESVSKGIYPYDDFVMRNMRIGGFLRTYTCLSNQLELLKQKSFIQDDVIKTI